MQLFRKNIKKAGDEELIKGYLQSHDQTLLAEVFTRYTHLVYGVCVKYLNNQDDASDAVMNIYEKLEKELHRHDVQRFSTWLYVITRNYCLMELRQRQSLEKNEEKWQYEMALFMESDDFVHPLDDDDLERQHHQLKKCLDQLKQEQKECIELFYYQNKCYQEIAHQLRMNEKNVKSHLQNGKRNLKICIESEK